jgi:crossover junction endodeoxyribonuclease RusA
VSEIVLDVQGYPAPQGSKRAWVNKHTGRAQMVEQSSDRISLWRQDVKAAALKLDPICPSLAGPLEIHVLFRFPRPKSHYRTGRNAALLRDNAPLFPCTRAVGDLDKCLRSTWDALVTAGVFGDDSQIAHTDAWKTYADAALPGATITIRTLDHDEEAT